MKVLQITARLFVVLHGFTLLVAPAGAGYDADSLHDWNVYGGDVSQTHYSTLDQLNRDNVGGLKPVWEYRSANGEALPASSELQVNPVVVDGILYGRNPNYNVFALHADSGEVAWTFMPSQQHVGLSNMRGVSYWDGSGARGDNDKAHAPRVYFTTSHFLFALDAGTGKLVDSFGSDGVVDLRQGLRREPEKLSVSVPSPGIIYRGLIILGSTVSETEGAAPGDIRAYDVVSGEMAWNFKTIPEPGEYGYDTWPKDAWKEVGGANAWAGLSLDTGRGIVFAPTGSPAPDFDGSMRAGANLFANSVLALNAETGERIWHYQTVHHDIWDRDLSAPPALVSVNTEDGKRDMVAQLSKQGVVFLLDRESGEPVFPIEEVAVPPSEIPGEQAYPTQPRVTLPEPFTRQAFTEGQITDINPAANNFVRSQYEAASEYAYYRPIGLQPTIMNPGFYGGANWGGGAFDPGTNLLYVNAMEFPAIVHYEKVEVDQGTTIGTGQFVYQKFCGGCHGAELQGFYPYAPPLMGVSGRLDKVAAMDIVVEGKGRMMPFSQLSLHERRAVLEYIYDYDQRLASGAPETEKPAEVAASKKSEAYVFAGYTPFMDDRYYPAIKPPWGTLNAIDLASGKLRWQIPLGEYEALSKEGVPPTGTLNYGGPVVTAGGLLMIAATADQKFRIFDKASGELLWQYDLPAAGYSTPATFMQDGRQYVVVVCSGGKLGTPSGDQYIAFALPEESEAAD